MKLLNLQFFKNHWPKILSVFLFILLAGAYVNIFAVFTPGQTLNPNCAPGTGGCIVSSGSTIPDQTGNSGKFLTTDGTGTLSWNTGTGSSPWLTNGTNSYYNAGRVGIGTDTPTALLDINTSATPTISYTQDNSNVTGLDDATYGGSYTGTISNAIYVSIDSVGATDTFSYSDNNGDCPQVSNVPITGLPQDICDGISVSFSSITGHSMSDAWNYNISFSRVALHIGEGINNYFTVNAIANESNFLGTNAGLSATSANLSNFLGSNAGLNATDAANSNFLGANAGSLATSAFSSNFLGYNSGYQALSSYYSNFLGDNSGYKADNASNSNFFGKNSGNLALNAQRSNFIGYQTGAGAINASNSIFIGQEAGSGDTVDNTFNGLSSILIGSFTNTGGKTNSILLGSGMSGAPILNTKDNQFMLAPTVTEMQLRGVDYSLPASQGGANTVLTNDGSGVLSWAAGGGGSSPITVVNSTNLFSGSLLAGGGVTSTTNSNFFGEQAGDSATNANSSNFFGLNSGSSATNASYSNFFGDGSGIAATDASFSNFLGNNAGNTAANASNSIFIGQQAGYYDTVDNTTNGLSSILIGSYTNTGGKTNSILLGSGLDGFPIANTKNNQFMLAPTVTEMQLRGVDYSLPASQGGASTVLTNDGSGGLTWAAVSGSGITLTTTGSSGAATLVGSVLNVPQYVAGTGLSSDADFNTKGGTSAGLNFTGVGAQYNTFLGYEAGYGGTVTSIADDNIAIGTRSLYSNTTGHDNVAIGNNALNYNTTGNSNSAQGFQSLLNNTTGYNNSGQGAQSLVFNTTGNNNTSQGGWSLLSNISGNNNTAQGFQSLYSNTTGNYNTAQGVNSLYSNTTGTYNIAIGIGAGRYDTSGITTNTTGNYSIFLGDDTRPQTNGQTNQIVIGSTAIGNGNNTATIGNSSLLRTYLTGINLKAGSATAGTAPLKFTAGTLLSTTEGGAIEYNGTHLYFTAIDSGTRYQLDQQSPGSLSLTTTGSSGPATLVGSVLNIPQYTAGTGLSSDAFLNTLGGTGAGLNLNGTAQKNTFIGYGAGKGEGSTNSANFNTAVGYYSMLYNTSGTNNAAFGSNSLYSNTTGGSNTSIGKDSLYYNTSGIENTATGFESLYHNTSGAENTAIGRGSSSSNTTGTYNFSGGWASLSFNTTGSYNVALGAQAFNSNVSGSKAVAIGYNAMYYANNTATPFDSNDVAVGYEALKGSTNSANNTGTANSALGYQTLFSNSSGYNNTAVGWQSLYFNTTGGNNLAAGSNSLGKNTTGHENTALGIEALYENTTTSSNTAVGWDAGRYYSSSPVANQTPSSSVYLGYDTRAGAAGDTNEIVIGASTVGNGSNTTTIGTGNVLYVGGSTIGANSKVARFTNNSGYCDISPVTGGISCSSDMTLKKNITTLDGKEFALQSIPIPLAPQTTLEKIMEITPVNYNWNPEKDTDAKHIGFIAQEMEQIFPSIVSTDQMTGLKSISYASITPYLVKGIQEMNLQIKDLQSLDTTDSTKVTLGNLITEFLSSATNNINLVFFGEVHTKKLCLDDVCITKDELQKVLDHTNTNMTASVVTPAVVTPETPAQTQTPTPSDATNLPIEPTPEPPTVLSPTTEHVVADTITTTEDTSHASSVDSAPSAHSESTDSSVSTTSTSTTSQPTAQ